MPAGSPVNVPQIPVATSGNLVQVCNAIRSYLIAQGNRDAGRADNSGTPVQNLPMATPSQFKITQVVFALAKFPTGSGNDTVTVPVIQTLQLVNQTTGETWLYQAPNAATYGATSVQALSTTLSS